MLNQFVGVIYWYWWYCPSKNRALTLNQPLLGLRSAPFVSAACSRSHILFAQISCAGDSTLSPHTRVRSWNLCTQLCSLLLYYLINNPDKIPSHAQRYSSQPGSSVTALQAIVNILNMKFINYSFSCIQHSSSLIAMHTFAILGILNEIRVWLDFRLFCFKAKLGEKSAE